MICSTFALIEFSATSQNFHLTIHKIFPIILAAFIDACIVLGNSGIFGAGGNNGNSISTLGIKDGSSGKIGGDGIRGIFNNVEISVHVSIHNALSSVDNHQFRSNDKSISGGVGISGKSGKDTDIGLKLKFGSSISVSIFISEKSKYRLGIFVGGICNIGKSTPSQIIQSLHEN